MDFCNKEKPEKCKKKVFSLTLLSIDVRTFLSFVSSAKPHKDRFVPFFVFLCSAVPSLIVIEPRH